MWSLGMHELTRLVEAHESNFFCKLECPQLLFELLGQLVDLSIAALVFLSPKKVLIFKLLIPSCSVFFKSFKLSLA